MNTCDPYIECNAVLDPPASKSVLLPAIAANQGSLESIITHQQKLILILYKAY